MKRGPIVLGLSLALLGAYGAPARATSAPSPGEGFTGSRWVAYAVEVGAGARLNLSVDASWEAARIRGGGLWLRHPDGSVSRYLFAAMGGGGSLTAQLPAGQGIDASVTPGGVSSLGISLQMEDPAPGSYSIVGVAAGDGAPRAGAARLRGSGFTVESASSGDEVFAVPSERFDGLRAGVNAGGLRASAVAGNVTHGVDAPLFGWFSSTGPASLRHRGPGVAGDGPATFDATPSGAYTFEATSASGVFAWGAATAWP